MPPNSCIQWPLMPFKPYRRIRSFGNQKQQKSESMYSKSSKLVEIFFCIVLPHLFLFLVFGEAVLTSHFLYWVLRRFVSTQHELTKPRHNSISVLNTLIPPHLQIPSSMPTTARGCWIQQIAEGECPQAVSPVDVFAGCKCADSMPISSASCRVDCLRDG
jgi:hypothetical protein